MTEMLSFEEFRRILAQELQIEESRVVPEASFVRDLQVDSLRLVEMFLRLEETGLSIPLEEAWDVETVEDAYRIYVRQFEAGMDLQPLRP